MLKFERSILYFMVAQVHLPAEAPKRKGRKSEAAGKGPESGTELGSSRMFVA